MEKSAKRSNGRDKKEYGERTAINRKKASSTTTVLQITKEEWALIYTSGEKKMKVEISPC